MSKRSRHSKEFHNRNGYHDDAMFHDQYENYNARTQSNRDPTRDLRDDEDAVAADESESYEEDATSESDGSSHSSGAPSKKQSDSDEDIESDQLLYDAHSPHGKSGKNNNDNEDDDIFALKCFMLVCLFFAALIVSLSVTMYAGSDTIQLQNTPLSIIDVNDSSDSRLRIHHDREPKTSNTVHIPINNNSNNIQNDVEKHSEPTTTATATASSTQTSMCNNAVFSATSWQSMNSPQMPLCQDVKQTSAGKTYLSPSEPDHILTAAFDCALDSNASQCLTTLHAHKPAIHVLRGSASASTVDIDCVTDAAVFAPIVFEYGPYGNHEQHTQCLRVHVAGAAGAGASSQDGNRELWLRDVTDAPLSALLSLRIEFEMLSMDVEQAFDNLLLSWQYNDVYTAEYVSWTGTRIAYTPSDGVAANQTLFWNVLSGDFIEICLHLKADESVTGKGYRGQFVIRRDVGVWSNWTQCDTIVDPKNVRFGGQCGVGVRRKHKHCSAAAAAGDDDDDDTSICVENESSIDEYCIKQNCEAFDNQALTPVGQRPRKLKDDDLEYRYNGRHRVDPIYPDPFRYILATNAKIDVDDMITRMKQKMKQIASRYSDERVLTYGIGQGINHWDSLYQRVQFRLLKSLLLGRRFVVTFTGSSNTAGHDNMFMSSYSMQLLSMMNTFWAEIGVKGAAFQVHNVAEGGHIGTRKLSWCMHEFVPRDSDFVFWESLMNDAGDKTYYAIYERWMRNVLSLPKQPIVGVINTGDAADRYGDKCPHMANGTALPYCKIADGVNIYWWREVFSKLYADHSDMLFVAAQRGCYGLVDAVPECTGMSVTWHPSPNGHRLLAETFAYWFLKVALDGLETYKSQIMQLSTIALECLLQEPKYNDEKRTALLQQDGRWCGASCAQSTPNWCTSSYAPMAAYKRMSQFVVRNEDDAWSVAIDGGPHSKMTPFIWRNGGQASIDDKMQFGTNKVGASVVIRVKVAVCCIVVLEPMSGGGDAWLQQFEFYVDQKRVACEYQGNIGGWSYDHNLNGCIIQTKAGKQDLEIKYVNRTKSGAYAAIDMLATF